MPNAVIYCRLSKFRGDGRSASTEQQEADCRRLAELRGLTVLDPVYIDDDTSGYRGKRRPQYEAMLDRLGAGDVEAVIAWHPDRIYRHLSDLERFIEVVQSAGADVLTAQAGDYDLSTPAGRMVARHVGVAARYEVEHRSERTKSAHRRIAAEGRWPGGRRPYGYRYAGGMEGRAGGPLEVDPEEAAVIREAARRILAGERTAAVVRDLNKRGILSASGVRWSATTLSGVLQSGTIAGRRVHRGEDVGAGVWPAIIDEVTSARLRATLADPTRARGPVARVALLAGGRARCGACGGPLRTAQRSQSTGGRRVYRCPSGDGCGGVQVAAEPLEKVVTAALLAALEGATINEAGDDEAETVMAEVEALEAELDELAADRGRGVITQREWLAVREPLAARLDAARSRLSAGGRGPRLDGFVVAPAETWAALDLGGRQATFDAMIASVTVAPSTRRGPVFDADRVSITWKA